MNKTTALLLAMALAVSLLCTSCAERITEPATAAATTAATTAPVQTVPETTAAANNTGFFSMVSDLDFYFSSGVGGWSTYMKIAADGSFTGDFHDSEMGEAGDGYPNGTVYGMLFHGRLSLKEQVTDNIWRLTIDSLEPDEGQLAEYIEDGIRYVTTNSPYGLENTTELLLYAPGVPVSELTESFIMWAHLNYEDPMPETLPCYAIYNEKEDTAFVAYTPAVG